LHAQNRASGSLTEPEYIEAILKREGAIHALSRVFKVHQVDVLLCTAPEIVAPITGFPSLSVPIGSREDRIPIGCYWIGKRYVEGTLLRIAFAAESLLDVRCTPDIS
jgi:Asp-tRNA(Asn)/Glu-tRNA(Gln) amidotransferase A subunit family amidase